MERNSETNDFSKDTRQKVMKRKRSDVDEQAEHTEVKHLKADNSTTSNVVSYYLKRSGTSGFGGQLYETRLLTLVLFRTLNSEEIERFLLGSNVDDIGAFDDLVLKRYERNRTKPKLLFVQSKHKDDPTKHRVTVAEVKKRGGDFSLDKYFQSYLQIVSNFHSSNNTIFSTKLDETDHEFVIYTNAENNVNEKDAVISDTSSDDVLYTGQGGKTLQFKSHYTEYLMCSLMEWRTRQLAESLADFVLSNDSSYGDIMTDEFIKCYHVLLARQVVQVSTEIFQDKSKENHTKYYREAKFLPEFLNNDDRPVSILRDTLYKKIVTHKYKSLLSQKEIINATERVIFSTTTINKLRSVEGEMHITQFRNELAKLNESPAIINQVINAITRNKVESLSFKVPSTFGNLDCAVICRRRLDDVSTKIADLLQNRETKHDNVVKINRNSIGSHKTLNGEDIELIGTFVGNLIVLEEETNMFMFNVDEDLLPRYAKHVLGVLKSKLSGVLNDCRLQVDVYGFPRLSLFNHTYIDEKIVSNFLNHFKIYTNQANESDVEERSIKEIENYYKEDKIRKKQLRIKSHAMYLRVHDEIQKWWKLQEELVPYLNQDCNFFEEAKSDICPLLTILNFMYTDKFNKGIEFNYETIEELSLDDFMNSESDKRMLHLVTEHHVLTAIKLYQYFDINNTDKYTFVDLDYVMKVRDYSDVCDALNSSKLDVVIIKYQAPELQNEFLDDIMEDITVRKIIFVSDHILPEEMEFVKDEKNNLVELTSQSQEKVLESTVIFQGEETHLKTIIDDEAKYLVKGEVLNKLINNEKIIIGKTLANTQYESIENYYIERKLSRCIRIKQNFMNDYKVNEENINGLLVVYDDKVDELFTTGDYDIILISNEIQHFGKLCAKYPRFNIHWFKKDNDNLIWEKSRGRLKRLFKYVEADDEYQDDIEQSDESDGSDENDSDFDVKVDSSDEDSQIQQNKHNPRISVTNLEPKAIRDMADNIVIVAAEPGMGKSTLLTHLSIETKKRDASAWIVKVNLVDLSSEFRKWQKSDITYDQVVKFLYKAIDFGEFNKNQNRQSKEKVFENILSMVTVTDDNQIVLNDKENKLQGINLFEMELFNYLHNRGRIVILLDGFDEICPDYTKEVMDLLEILRQSKAERLWITTRSGNIQNKLEDNLHTFSYVLEPFSSDDQMMFLKMFWTANLELEEIRDTLLVTFCDTIMKYYKSFAKQRIAFTSIPMNIYMIAKIFQNLFKNFHDREVKNMNEIRHEVEQNLDVVQLYKRYIDIKIRDIFFEEKKGIKNMYDPSIKELVEENKEQCIESHKLLAIRTIFTEDVLTELLTEYERQELEDLVLNIEKGKERMGFVERVVDGRARFVHQTFAEYFAAEFICDKLKSNFNAEKKWQFLIETVFTKDFDNVRRFFSSKLADDLEVDDLGSHKDYKKRIFDLLMKQAQDPFVYDTALSNAMAERLYNILGFLINTFEGNVNQENLDDFIKLIRKGDFLVGSIEFGSKSIVETVFNTVKNLNRDKLIDIVHYVDKHGNFSPLTGAFRSANVEMCDIVLKDLTDVELVKVISIQYPEAKNRTVLHDLAKGSEFAFLEPYLEILNDEQLIQIATIKDNYDRTAAHYAGRDIDLFFFKYFQGRLNRVQLNKIFSTADRDGKTAVEYLGAKMDMFDESVNNWFSEFRLSLIGLDD